MSEEVALRSLRDRPFELLAELERLARAVSAQVAQEGTVGREWVGVALRMAGDLYLVAREETREVFGVPAGMTRVPGAKPWIKGLANVRGQLLPIIDLRQFLGSGTTPITRNTRVMVVNHRDIPAGLLVDGLVLGVDHLRVFDLASRYGLDRKESGCYRKNDVAAKQKPKPRARKRTGCPQIRFLAIGKGIERVYARGRSLISPFCDQFFF